MGVLQNQLLRRLGLHSQILNRLPREPDEVIAQDSPWLDLRGQTHAPPERLKRILGRDPN